jgi:hypothetical protein
MSFIDSNLALGGIFPKATRLVFPPSSISKISKLLNFSIKLILSLL